MKVFYQLFLFAVIFFGVSINTFSQVDSLIIYLKDGSQKSIAIDDIDKAEFNSFDILYQEIILSSGWNLISSNIKPKLPDNMENIWVNNTDKLIIVKNNSGEVYIPQYGINSIGKWDISQGYQVYVNAADTLYILGEEVNPLEQNVLVKSGWNLIAYLRNEPMNATNAFVSVTDNNNLVIAKNNAGQVYIPGFGINSIGNLLNGQGYRVYVTNNDAINYPENPVASITVQIGTQHWMKKNLDVSNYRNGDLIRQATSNADWLDAGNKKEGAWCYYNNDPILGAIYGKIYNWYAVNDPRGLAPVGYHVPSDAEWTTLDNFLKSNNQFWCSNNSLNIGKSLSSTTRWNTSANSCAIGKDLNLNNTTGFTALPGGQRLANGNFLDLNTYGAWWSSTSNSATNATYSYLYNYDSRFFKTLNNKAIGYSVRCLKD